MVKSLAQKIYDIVKDYREEDNIHISPDYICEWAYQFEDEAEFMLSELSHLLPQIYFSKERVLKEMKNILDGLCKYLKYDSIESLFKNVDFLCLQANGKSQHILLQMISF